MPRSTQVIMTETMAPVVAVSSLASRLAGCKAIVFIDSEASEGALIKGYSPSPNVGAMAGVFWLLAVQLDLAVYIERAPTDGNPSDGPSRGDLDEAMQHGAVPLPARHLDLTENLDDWARQAGHRARRS